MSKYDDPLKNQNLELHEVVDCGLDLPVPATPLKSWRGIVDAAAALRFSETQLERFWSDPEFVKKRNKSRVHAEFEL